jgi:hypothetical protein
MDWTRPEHMAVVTRLGFCAMSIETPVREDPFPLLLRGCINLIDIFVVKGTY